MPQAQFHQHPPQIHYGPHVPHALLGKMPMLVAKLPTVWCRSPTVHGLLGKINICFAQKKSSPPEPFKIPLSSPIPSHTSWSIGLQWGYHGLSESPWKTSAVSPVSSTVFFPHTFPDILPIVVYSPASDAINGLVEGKNYPKHQSFMGKSMASGEDGFPPHTFHPWASAPLSPDHLTGLPPGCMACCQRCLRDEEWGIQPRKMGILPSTTGFNQQQPWFSHQTWWFK